MPKQNLGLLVILAALFGCHTSGDQDKPRESSSAPVVITPHGDAQRSARSQGLAGPLLDPDKLKSDMKAAGFSLADPNVHWGVTIVVDAAQPTGGFAYEASEGIIKLRWDKVPEEAGCQIFRSTEAVIPLMMQNILTMDARAGSASADTDVWSDNSIDPHAHNYYYAVLATTKTGRSVLAATGVAVTSRQGEAQAGSNADNSASRSSNETIGDEEAERRELRRQQHLSPHATGQDAANAPNGTYGSGWGFNSEGYFTFYAADDHGDEYAHPFEYHKLSDGRYSLVGYVDDDTAAALSHHAGKVIVAVYAHRWSKATRIVSLPVERLSHYLYPRPVTVDGKRNTVIGAEWN
jgi:hypothetical protein